MLNPIPLQRPNAANLSSRLPAAPCCLAEPMTFRTSFDTLYDFAFIRSVPELADHSYWCLKHGYVSRYLDEDFTLGIEAMDKICSEFTRLILAQYRLQVNTDDIRSCQSWLQICTVSHPECTPKRSSFTPTRLLEVSFSSKPILRLRSSTDFIDRKPQYVALSYVWDSDHDFVQLGKSLFENHTVDVDRLPPKFAKAISAINQLDRHYLWIDSLCINKGDIEKRCFTISDMAQVYQNADVTLIFGGNKGVGGVTDKVISRTNSKAVTRSLQSDTNLFFTNRSKQSLHRKSRVRTT